MSHRILIVAIVVLMPVWAAEGIPERIDALLERWEGGDEAARTGVAAETIALGEPAVGELYRRLAGPRAFGGSRLGLPSPALDRPVRSNKVISVEIAFWQPKGEGWEGPDVARVIEDPERYTKSGQLLSAPRLTTYEGQLANVSVVRQQNLKQGIARLGLVVEMRAFVDESGDRVTLGLRVEHCEPCGDLDGIPQLLKRESAFKLTLEPGKRSGVRLPPVGDQGPLAILIRAEPVMLEEIELDGG